MMNRISTALNPPEPDLGNDRIPLSSFSSRPICLAFGSLRLRVGRRCLVPVGGEERGQRGQQRLGSLLGDPVGAAGDD